MLWFKKKDPICGMKETEGKGIKKYENWFCSNDCLKEYEKRQKEQEKSRKEHGGCC